MRAARRDAHLDHGADVVGVDVDVPQPGTADDDEGVTELGEPRAQRRDRGVVGIEQEHHLVRAATLVEVVDVERDRRGARPGVAAYAGDGLDEGVEDDDEAAPPGVDHARAAEHLELVGRAGERVRGRVGGGGDEGLEARARTEPGDGVGGRPCDGEHGPLARVGHGGVGGVGGPTERGDEDLVVGQDARRVLHGRERLGEPPDELAQDDPGVAAGTEQGAVGEAADDAAQVEVVVDLVQVRRGRLEREEQVRTGVAVRHREHVEGVDLGPVAAEPRQAEVRPTPDPGRVEVLEHASPRGRGARRGAGGRAGP